MVKRAGGALLLAHRDRSRRGAAGQHAALCGLARPDPVRRVRRRRAAARYPHAGPRPRRLAHDRHRGLRSADRRRADRVARRLRHIRERRARCGPAAAPAPERRRRLRRKPSCRAPWLGRSAALRRRGLRLPHVAARLHHGAAGLRRLPDGAVGPPCGQALARQPRAT